MVYEGQLVSVSVAFMHGHSLECVSDIRHSRPDESTHKLCDGSISNKCWFLFKHAVVSEDGNRVNILM